MVISRRQRRKIHSHLMDHVSNNPRRRSFGEVDERANGHTDYRASVEHQHDLLRQVFPDAVVTCAHTHTERNLPVINECQVSCLP